MQTEAEKYLIKSVNKHLLRKDHVSMINLGAAKSTIIEESLNTHNFVCDRIDIQDCTVKKDVVGKCFVAPLEDMSQLKNRDYDLAFANFVMEHVSDPEAAASEISRIMKSGGILVMSLSNPKAPEFILAKITPTWFHQLFRKEDQDEAYPVKYSYGSIENIIGMLGARGFILLEHKSFGTTHSYLYSWPLISSLAKFYDKIGIKGHSVLVLRKN